LYIFGEEMFPLKRQKHPFTLDDSIIVENHINSYLCMKCPDKIIKPDCEFFSDS
jgi:hypothetical protein